MWVSLPLSHGAKPHSVVGWTPNLIGLVSLWSGDLGDTHAHKEMPHVNIITKIGVMLLGTSQKMPRMASKSPEARREGWNRFFSHSVQKEPKMRIPWLQTSGLLNCCTIHFCCLYHLGCVFCYDSYNKQTVKTRRCVPARSFTVSFILPSAGSWAMPPLTSLYSK